MTIVAKEQPRVTLSNKQVECLKMFFETHGEEISNAKLDLALDQNDFWLLKPLLKSF